MNTELKQKMLEKNKWLRGLFMLFFLFAEHIVSWIILVCAVFQFIWNLCTDKHNEKLVAFTKNLNVYQYQIINFLTYNTGVKPFPFAHWPNCNQDLTTLEPK